MLYLIASLIALLLGPICYRLLSSGNGLQKGLDGFLFVSLGGLVLVHILPELLEHGGWVSLLFVVIGLWGPSASERIFHKYSDTTHKITIFLGVSGLLLHTLTDGGALVLAQQPGNSGLLALGVILHRLPVGIAIWSLLKPQVGTRWALLVLSLMIVLTAAGYVMGEQLLTHLSLDNTVYLQAFVTGSILHVVLHQPHVHHSHQHAERFQYHAGIGSLLGLALLFVLLIMDSEGHAHDYHLHEMNAFWSWSLNLAPILLLSYVAVILNFVCCAQLNHVSTPLTWILRLTRPEAVIISAFMLGFSVAAVHILIGAIILLFLRHQTPSTLSSTTTTQWQFAFSQYINHSAPLILVSLVTGNLIHQTHFLLDQPLLQLGFICALFTIFKFDHLSAACFAVILAFCGWSQPSIVLALVAAPLLHYQSLLQFNVRSHLGAFIVLIGGLWLSHSLKFMAPVDTFSVSASSLCALIIGFLFAMSLLQLGPRKFLQPLLVYRPHTHHH